MTGNQCHRRSHRSPTDGNLQMHAIPMVGTEFALRFTSESTQISRHQSTFNKTTQITWLFRRGRSGGCGIWSVGYIHRRHVHVFVVGDLRRLRKRLLLARQAWTVVWGSHRLRFNGTSRFSWCRRCSCCGRGLRRCDRLERRWLIIIRIHSDHCRRTAKRRKVKQGETSKT